MKKLQNIKAGVVALCVLFLTACQVDLFTRLSEADANELLDTLYSSGLEATKVLNDDKTWTVQVQKDDLQRAVRIARENGLPQQKFASTGDVFKKEGLISTPSEERIRFVYAISQELSHTISQIDGVVSARVHVVIPANDPLADKVKPSSASVFVKHRSNANLQELAPAIKNLVMRGIEGLAYDDISLTFFVSNSAPVTNVVPRSFWSRLDAWFVAVAAIFVGVGLGVGGVLLYRWRYPQQVDYGAVPHASTGQAAGASNTKSWLRVMNVLFGRTKMSSNTSREATSSNLTGHAGVAKVNTLQVVSADKQRSA
jgi:type III secretion protein J